MTSGFFREQAWHYKAKWHLGTTKVFCLNTSWLLTHCVVRKRVVLFPYSCQCLWSPVRFISALSPGSWRVLADINSCTFLQMCILLVSVAVRACLHHEQLPPKVCGPRTVTCDWPSTARWPSVPTRCRGREESRSPPAVTVIFRPGSGLSE